jgi:hypothetical protein
MALPIIFIHKGYSSYLEFSLRQAKFTSPSSPIILLGDETNSHLSGLAQHVNMNDYFNSAEQFGRIYQHYSTNPYNYELFCFQRWLALEEFIFSSGFTDFFVCDSDVLLYTDINDVNAALFSHYIAALAIYGPECASAGISYWKISALSEFCRTLPAFFNDNNKLLQLQKMWSYNREHNILGGFSDMTAATEFNNAALPGSICNMLSVHDNSTFDTQINTSLGGDNEIYRFKFGKKVFTWQSGIPYCLNLTRNAQIRFHLIHFQGPAKYMMAFYYTGPNFHGKLKLYYKYLLLNTAAFWYKTLRIRYRFAFIFDKLNSKKR